MDEMPLVDQVAHLLGRSPEDVRPQVEALIRQIREQIDREGEVALDGLGTFRRQGAGLDFEPDRELLEIVNPLHGGLPTLERSPDSDAFLPRDAPDLEEPDQPGSSELVETAFGWAAPEPPAYSLRNEGRPEPRDRPPRRNEPGRDYRPEVPDPDVRDATVLPPVDEQPGGEGLPDEEGPIFDDAEPIFDDAEPIFDEEEPVVLDEEEPILFERSSPRGDLEEQRSFVDAYRRIRARNRSDRKRRERREFLQELFFLLFVIAAVLVAVVWFTFSYMGQREASRPPDPGVAVLTPAPAAADSLVAASDSAAAVAASGTAAADSLTLAAAGEGTGADPEPAPPSEQPAAEPGPAAPFSPSDGNWVWAVASETNRAAAENLLRTYATADMPGEVVPAVIDGRTWYRVTLGRFRTRAAAEAARNRLPSGVPPDAYVRSIR